jgi:hypothetical protein
MIRSVGENFIGNMTEGEWKTLHFYSEFPEVKKLNFHDVSCETADYSWVDVGYDASYMIAIYDIDKAEGVYNIKTRVTTVFSKQKKAQISSPRRLKIFLACAHKRT